MFYEIHWDIAQKYRKIKEEEYHFDKGVNIILGNNEAGKSTLIDSIITVLFKDSSVNSKSFKSVVFWWFNLSWKLIPILFVFFAQKIIYILKKCNLYIPKQ